MQFHKKHLIPFIPAIAVFLSVIPSATQAAETAADHPLVIQELSPGPNDIVLSFEENGHPTQVIRQKNSLRNLARDVASTTETQARAIVNALVDGPTEAEKVAGITAFLPEGSSLGGVQTTAPDTIRINLDLPPDFVQSTKTYSPQFVEETSSHFIDSLLSLGFHEFYFYVKDPISENYKPIRSFLPQSLELPPVQNKSDITPPASPDSTKTASMETRNVPTQNGFVAGGLTGKSVVLNQSHGWLDDNDPNYWRVQRGRTFEVLEDYGSAMFMNQYVIPLLQNVGARVRPVREPDIQANSVVVDNAAGAPKYQEQGSGWASSTADGFISKSVYSGTQDNPFGASNATRYVFGVNGAATASATYTTKVPEDGYYNVYISYSQGGNRTKNAHWQVYHSGGVTDFRINQEIGGGTWVLLGNFYFEKNAPASQSKLVVLNDSGDNQVVSCDAVRLGGGMGNVARRTHGVSGVPRWQEEANNYMQYTGMLASTLMKNDYTGTYDDEQLGWSNRPQYANWEQSRDNLGSNIVYIGWHTNASGGDYAWKCNYNGSGSADNVEVSGGGRGTTTYRDVAADATAATERLTTTLHDDLIASIQTYQSDWYDRGINGSNGYGESSQGNLGSVAGFFFEGLFHDNSSDSSAYKDPKFRYVAARGIVHGLIRYYGGTTFPPEPVTNFRAQNTGNSQIKLSWTRGVYTSNVNSPYGSIPTKYRVFKSSNGYGFDNGVDTATNTTQYTTTLAPGTTTFYRISAVNSAGISVPSETLAVRVPTSGSPTVLIVNGYHRNDQYLGPLVSSPGIGGCAAPTNTYRSMDPNSFQSFNYTIQHAQAIAAKGGFGINSCSKDAINLHNINLTDYPMVFWIGGQEGEADLNDNVDDSAFRANEQSAIAAYLTNGGNLFISGSEIAWDFGRSVATSTKKQFLSNYLKATYVRDSSNTYAANGTSGVFSGLGTIHYDDGTGNTYGVRFPDVISPTGGASTCMTYSGGTGGTAAIQYAGTFGSGTKPGKLIYMGFGFETITSTVARYNLINRAIDNFTPSGITEWSDF